jgi:uncharacterized protein (TIGR02145 family)
MKNLSVKLLLILCVISGLLNSAFAQAPEGIIYQAEARNNKGYTISNANLDVKITILQDDVNGTIVWEGLHNVTTNCFGVFVLVIGEGTSGYVFEDIKWAEHLHFLNVQVKKTGTAYNGNHYNSWKRKPKNAVWVDMGTTQLLSVPYALHAKTAEGITGTITETQNLADVIALNDSANSQIKNVTDPTDAQDVATKAYVTLRVSLTDDTLFLGAGQWVIIPGISAENGGGESTIIDGSGNEYTYVTIGSQDWLVENLKTTKYNDGTDIPLITDNTSWGNLTTPGYCWYNNDKATYGDTYGALYNWQSVNTGNLCPTGWHVPTDAEWTTLTTNLSDPVTAGGKLKETGTTHWTSPNTGATNETGFTALPGGNRRNDGTFRVIGVNGYWWSASEYAANTAWNRHMHYDYSDVSRYFYSKKNGSSVRCLRD